MNELRCLELAGVDYPSQIDGRELLPLAGKSLLPSLRDPDHREPRTLYWEHNNSKAIRDGDWKLVADRNHGRWELYDLAADRTELNDVSKDHPDKARALADKWDAWAARVGGVEGIQNSKKSRRKNK